VHRLCLQKMFYILKPGGYGGFTVITKGCHYKMFRRLAKSEKWLKFMKVGKHFKNQLANFWTKILKKKISNKTDLNKLYFFRDMKNSFLNGLRKMRIQILLLQRLLTKLASKLSNYLHKYTISRTATLTLVWVRMHWFKKTCILL